jgi:hypothetical protein
MNAYTTRSQSRIQPGDFAAVRPANRFMVGGSLAGLEQQCGWQAEAKVNWLLKQHGVVSKASTSIVSMLRQAIGAVLVRAGERLVGMPRSSVLLETTPPSTLGTTTSLGGWHSVAPGTVVRWLGVVDAGRMITEARRFDTVVKAFGTGTTRRQSASG